MKEERELHLQKQTNCKLDCDSLIESIINEEGGRSVVTFVRRIFVGESPMEIVQRVKLVSLISG